MKEEKKIDILSKVSLILIGVFVASVIFAIATKNFGTTGLYLGLLTTLALSFGGFYYIEKGTVLRQITWGITVTIVIGVVGYIVLLSTVSQMLEGF